MKTNYRKAMRRKIAVEILDRAIQGEYPSEALTSCLLTCYDVLQEDFSDDDTSLQGQFENLQLMRKALRLAAKSLHAEHAQQQFGAC